MYFGTIAVGDNSVVSSISMDFNGNTSSTGSIYILSDGQPAELEISNFPARKELTLSADTPTVLTRVGGGTNTFTATSISIPSLISTDGTGYALVPIGGTLVTSGNSQSYLDGTYRWSLQITVTYN